ncbi:MAG TPA: DUF423 domain-containing protein [Flavihumibacter sp.]|nr:DUF423 domain-containing protein [Flavihumibacter sp.]HPZ89612.1 DUF423 domain-containing protein [Flavihumibacter sp.]HQD10656.1 DUF423 domain-containing protein [Flavihumibacter sp.]
MENKLTKKMLRSAAVLGALAVILGAFGAHGLKQIVPAESISTFETGVRYQFYHVFALAFCGLFYMHHPSVWVGRAAICFEIGILLFSGSLYLLTALKATSTVGLGGLGIITPIGGLFFIAGWLLLAWAVQKSL